MNVLIIEDEPHTADLLREIIEQDSGFMVVNTIDSISDAVIYITKYQSKLDLIFMDIHLTDGPSFEIFKHVDIRIPVVFCTSYDEYTLQAIKNNGIDYILKPFKDSEICEALNKYKSLVDTIHSRMTNFIQPVLQQTFSPGFQESFLTQQKEKSVVIRTRDIALFAIEDEMVYIYTFDKKRVPFFKNMEYIESACDPQFFFRINRQMLVHRDNIVSLEPYFNRKVVLHLHVEGNAKALVSRMNVSSLKKWIERG
ncbi:MAG: LytR/AlgR family response regulator transcription factor [Bacteroidales bacterium]